mmetsp:Transcript_99116/g.308917  ORF Transcript_99116/g.308917 Transcript_99116/m.308917 type:complete len:238 (-) Transcript_99116:53-766(-)
MARFADRDLYTKAISLLPEDVKESFALALVEPNTIFYPMLASNAMKLPMSFSQVKFVPGMVTDLCSAPNISMYRFSYQAHLDFGARYMVYDSWFGADKAFPMRALRGFAAQKAYPPFTEEQMQAFRRFDAAPNASAYVQEIKVPCHTPSSLLASLGVQASDLAMVVIDAEGSDTKILNELIKLPGFRPGYLQWEAGNPGKIGTKLQELGYKVGGVSSGGGGSDAENAVAVLVEPSTA